MKRWAWCLAVVVQSGAVGLSVAADRAKSAKDVTNNDKVVLVAHRGASHAAPDAPASAPAPSEAPAAVASPATAGGFVATPSPRFGEAGPVRIEEMPAGRLRTELTALPAGARERALAQLGRLQVPRQDVASLRADRNGRLFYLCLPPSAPRLEAALLEAEAEPAATAPAADAIHSHRAPGT